MCQRALDSRIIWSPHIPLLLLHCTRNVGRDGMQAPRGVAESVEVLVLLSALVLRPRRIPTVREGGCRATHPKALSGSHLERLRQPRAVAARRGRRSRAG